MHTLPNFLDCGVPCLYRVCDIGTHHKVFTAKQHCFGDAKRNLINKEVHIAAEAA